MQMGLYCAAELLVSCCEKQEKKIGCADFHWDYFGGRAVLYLLAVLISWPTILVVNIYERDRF